MCVPLNLNGSKIHTIYLDEFLKLMIWWHDEMQEMAWWMHKQNKSHDKTQNSRKSSGAPGSGRYNTPPLQEDLVPRSRMAPEGKTKEKEKR